MNDFDDETRREHVEEGREARTLEQEIANLASDLDDLAQIIERDSAELALLRAEHDAARIIVAHLMPQRAMQDPRFVVWMDAWTETETAR